MVAARVLNRSRACVKADHAQDRTMSFTSLILMANCSSMTASATTPSWVMWTTRRTSCSPLRGSRSNRSVRARENSMEIDASTAMESWARRKSITLSRPPCIPEIWCITSSLAAYAHLDRWLERMASHGADIAQIGCELGLPAGADVIQHVGLWAYEGAFAASAKAWQAPRIFETVDERYPRLFEAAPAQAVLDEYGRATP